MFKLMLAYCKKNVFFHEVCFLCFFMLFYVFNFKTMVLIDIIFEAIKFKYQLAVYLQTSTTS